MRLSKLVGKRTKDTPREAACASHAVLLRGGYARQVAAGIYSLLPLGARVARKIEALIREEMDAVDGQEVVLPVVQPRELWEESGRYAAIDASMVRLKDRTDKDYVLAMTHEEAVVHAARSELTSYKQLPFMLYQLQTKFRDELRPRGGLIRVREFTMKDAYSFHRDAADLSAWYQRVYAAYLRIFARAGLKSTVVVESDTGMMGGKVAHEFMLVSDVGEDRLVLCDGCGYAANDEVAVSRKAAAGTTTQVTVAGVRITVAEGRTLNDVKVAKALAAANAGDTLDGTDLVNVEAGDACVRCGGALRLARGVEIGNIFQLGVKYTASMGMSYLDEQGRAQTPLMGCYGIGVGRLVAAAIEDAHDARGPLWNAAIAPFQVHLCALGAAERADAVYRELTAAGLDVVWDDTDAQAGAQFADADLIGAPVRLVVSARTEQRGVVEWRRRDGSAQGELGFAGLADAVRRLL